MKKILIVDDETEFADMISMRLEANGYDVVTAADGLEGLEKARTEDPDLILLDVMMPNLDGFETLKRLRQSPTTADTRVVMLTARGETKSIFRGQELGVDDYLIKPCDSEELLSVCKKYCRR